MALKHTRAPAPRRVRNPAPPPAIPSRRPARSGHWFAALAAIALGITPPGAASAAAGAIDIGDYADNAAAQAAWKPMRGSVPAAATRFDGQPVLRLTCNFQDGIERASWDKQVNLNLSSSRGFELKIFCRDASPVSYFSLYFQSGEGWYHATFFPESPTDWNTILIDKAGMTVEGTPAGWSRISAIRVSAWRGRERNTEFYFSGLREIGVLGVDASIAILSSDSTERRSAEEARNVEQYTEAVAGHLRALGMGYGVIREPDATVEMLKRAGIVVLPYNPLMPEKVVAALSSYLAQGGKLLAFHTLPERLRESLGLRGGRHVKAAAPGNFASIRFPTNSPLGAPPVVNQDSWNITAFEAGAASNRVLAEWFTSEGRPAGYAAVLGSTNFIFMTHVLLPDDPENKRRMLLALTGALAPELWRSSAIAAWERIGVFSSFKSYEAAVAGITSAPEKKESAARALASADKARELARKRVEEGRFPESFDQSATANRLLLEAFYRSQPSATGEFRAFWCHSAFGVRGMDWDEAIGRLAGNGFNAIIPNMLWGGVTFHPGKVLPVAPEVAARGDQIALCLAACRKHKVQLHVWKVNWNLGQAAPADFVARMRREGRLQRDSAGQERLWLCPSHPRNQKLEIDSMVEVASRYPVDGLHFDYIRYPDSDHCFCAGCRERFRRAMGRGPRAWPGDVLDGGALRQRWLEWRRGNITTVVKDVSERARAARPGIRISAAVFPNWSTERDSIGQDWKLWCERGYLDFVCPMDYTPSNGSFENMLRRQVEWAGKTRCHPGIGFSASSSPFGADKVVDQINISRRYGTGGFVIFNYGPGEARELLPLLGLGITSR
jgi:uncharacterized lipoprotein YddW (UPF0748 family)